MDEKVGSERPAIKGIEILDAVDLEQNEKGEEEGDTPIKSGIILSGHSLFLFKTVEAALKARKKGSLDTLLSNFVNACQKILKYCPGMSQFEGPRRGELSTVLTIAEAKQLLDKDFFNSIQTLLFVKNLQGENLDVMQTEQVLGTFFILSLLKLYKEVLLQSLFEIKLKELAKELRDKPLENAESMRTNGCSYISDIFKLEFPITQLKDPISQQFESIFENLQLINEKGFVDLMTLFFLKPFPTEILINARFVLENANSITADPNFAESTDLKQTEELLKTDAEQIKTVFESVINALKIVRDKKGFQISNEKKISDEFMETMKIYYKVETQEEVFHHAECDEIIRKPSVKTNLNIIFRKYLIENHDANDLWKYFQKILEVSPEIINKAVKKFILNIALTLKNFSEEDLPKYQETVLTPPSDFESVPIEGRALFRVHLANFLNRPRRLVCCYPPNRETFSAFLNANPLVKGLLLSQIPISVVLQILRVNTDFKDISTVMWFEPPLGVIGFACGVYALKNPEKINALARISEAVSNSAVVLSKCLGLAILAHTALFPNEGKANGIDLDRFVKVVASGPVAFALLSLAYNSISPHFKEKYFSKRARFLVEFINHFTIYSGLNQIISNIIVRKMVNGIEPIDFSNQSNRLFLELVPMLFAVFFAHARIAPIYVCCKKNNVYINISETVNTTVLYGLTTVLLTNLGMDLSGDNNLSTEQNNFRRFFFAGLIVSSTAVMYHFAKPFFRAYKGNPEIIIQKVIEERGLQPRGDGSFGLPNTHQLLLNTGSELMTLTPATAETFTNDKASDRPDAHKTLLWQMKQKQTPERNNDEATPNQRGSRFCTIL